MKKKFEIWPVAIILSFVLFIGGIVTAASMMMRQRVDLVTEEYYEEEIAYQNEIDLYSATKEAGKVPEVSFDRSTLKVTIRFADGEQPREGKIIFYRPSDARLDFELAINPDAEGIQRIDAGDLVTGMWQVRVDWTENGQQYLHEQKIML